MFNDIGQECLVLVPLELDRIAVEVLDLEKASGHHRVQRRIGKAVYESLAGGPLDGATAVCGVGQLTTILAMPGGVGVVVGPAQVSIAPSPSQQPAL